MWAWYDGMSPGLLLATAKYPAPQHVLTGGQLAPAGLPARLNFGFVRGTVA